GNRNETRVLNADGGLISHQINGEYETRVDRLCEDTAVIDRNNGLTFIDRDPYGFIRLLVLPDGRRFTFEEQRPSWPELDQPSNVTTQPWGTVRITRPSGTVVNFQRNSLGK